MGGSLVAQHGAGGLAGVGSAGCDSRESDDLFGPLWFAVPKKRVSRRFWLFATDSQHLVAAAQQEALLSTPCVMMKLTYSVYRDAKPLLLFEVPGISIDHIHFLIGMPAPDHCPTVLSASVFLGV